MQNTKPHSNEVQSGPESSLTSAIWDKCALLLLNSQFTLQPPTAPFPPLSGHLTTLSTFPAVLTMHPHTPSPLPKRLPFVVNRLITFVSQQAAQEVSWSVLLSFCFSSIQSQFKGKKRSHQLLKETYSLLWSQFRFFYLSSFRQHFVWCRGWSLYKRKLYLKLIHRTELKSQFEKNYWQKSKLPQKWRLWKKLKCHFIQKLKLKYQCSEELMWLCECHWLEVTPEITTMMKNIQNKHNEIWEDALNCL